MTVLIAGLAFGLVGSGHCAAMCGPLMLLANPRSPGPGAPAASSRSLLVPHVALYHAGRAATYLTLGALAGLAGGAIARSGFGRGLAVLAGLVLLLQAIAASGLAGGAPAPVPLAAPVTQALGRAGAWMRRHRVGGPLLFGALNGLLPCGLLYAALTAAAGLGNPRQALAFMGAFTLGTTPVLAGLALAGGALTRRMPLAVRRAAPVALAIVGMLLIARGVRAPHGQHGLHSTTPTRSTATTPHQH